MSMTMLQSKEKDINNDIFKMKRKIGDLKFKIERKKKEGVASSTQSIFNDCLNFFLKQTEVSGL